MATLYISLLYFAGNTATALRSCMRCFNLCSNTWSGTFVTCTFVSHTDPVNAAFLSYTSKDRYSCSSKRQVRNTCHEGCQTREWETVSFPDHQWVYPTQRIIIPVVQQVIYFIHSSDNLIVVSMTVQRMLLPPTQPLECFVAIRGMVKSI